MKIQIVNGLVNILGEVKFLTAKNDAVRNALLDDYLSLRDAARDADTKRRDIVDKFNADYKGLDTTGEDYKNGLAVLNKAVGDILSKEVDIPLQSVALGDFRGISGAETLTLEQIAFLIEWGIVRK